MVEHVGAPGRNYKPRSAHLEMIEKISPDGKMKQIESSCCGGPQTRFTLNLGKDRNESRFRPPLSPGTSPIEMCLRDRLSIGARSVSRERWGRGFVMKKRDCFCCCCEERADRPWGSRKSRK
jgi:hypothetical protein